MSIGRNAKTAIRLLLVVSLAAVLGGWVAVPASAGEVDDWAKEADKTLRGAQRLIFSGKKEEAANQLDAADALLKKIEAADAEYTKLKSLRGKYEKLKKDLARRTGTGESGSTPPAADKSKGKKPAALPRSAREAMRDYQRTNKKARVGFVSMEGYVVAKLFCEAVRSVQGDLSRASFLRAIAEQGRFDLGGVELEFGPNDHQGMSNVFLTVIRDGRIQQLED